MSCKNCAKVGLEEDEIVLLLDNMSLFPLFRAVTSMVFGKIGSVLGLGVVCLAIRCVEGRDKTKLDA